MMENTGLQAVYDVNNNRNYDSWGGNGSYFYGNVFL